MNWVKCFLKCCYHHYYCRVLTGREKSWFLETEKLGPEKSWNWTLVLKMSWKSADIWSQRCWKFSQASTYVGCGALVRPLWSKFCNSTVTFMCVIIDNKPIACSFTGSCFGIKFIGWGPKRCKSTCWLFWYVSCWKVLKKSWIVILKFWVWTCTTSTTYFDILIGEMRSLA